MDGGSEDERKDHGAENAADDGDSERLEHGGPSADAEGQRKHASDGGQRGHSDGAEAAAAGLDHCLFSGEAEFAEAMLGVEEENAVFCDDADDHDHAHAGGDVERGVGDQQSEKTSEAGEQRGGKNGRRRRESTKFEEQHGKQEQQSQK